jgi:type IV pilus assembly protein PilZ
MSTTAAEKEATVRTSALSLNIKELAVLYAAYMPFLRGGGLFIPTNKTYHLGDEVFMFISLPGEDTRLPAAGHVVWLTPPGAQGNKAPGVGVQFKDDGTGRHARARIETLLAGFAKTTQPTHTL